MSFQHAGPCERRRLAGGDFALVEQCGCGVVHVTVGAVTLRLHADALPALARVLEDGARELVLQQLGGGHPRRGVTALS